MNTTEPLSVRPMTDFVKRCKEIRAEIGSIGEDVNGMRTVPIMAEAETNINELRANVTLAYRHLEDAAMRLGKAIQAFDGGKSVYKG